MNPAHLFHAPLDPAPGDHPIALRRFFHRAKHTSNEYFSLISRLRLRPLYPILRTVRNAHFDPLQVAPLRRSSVAPLCRSVTFASSGLDVGEFCRREAISAASLYRWRTLLGEAAQGGQNVARAATPAFLDLGTLNSAAASRPRLDLTLELGDGLSLHLVRH
jgi:hypothetical protein